MSAPSRDWIRTVSKITEEAVDIVRGQPKGDKDEIRPGRVTPQVNGSYDATSGENTSPGGGNANPLYGTPVAGSNTGYPAGSIGGGGMPPIQGAPAPGGALPCAPNTTGQYGQVTQMVSEGGHNIELNDTMGSESIKIQHANGSGIEIRADGTVVITGTKLEYNILGNADFVVEGNTSFKSSGNFSIDAGGGMELHSGNEMMFKTPASMVVDAGRNYTLASGRNYSQTIAGIKTSNVLGERVDVSLAGYLHNVKADIQLNVDGNAGIHSSSNLKMTGQSSVVMSSPIMSIAGERLNVLGASGTIGGQGIVTYSLNSNVLGSVRAGKTVSAPGIHAQQTLDTHTIVADHMTIDTIKGVKYMEANTIKELYWLEFAEYDSDSDAVVGTIIRCDYAQISTIDSAEYIKFNPNGQSSNTIRNLDYMKFRPDSDGTIDGLVCLNMQADRNSSINDVAIIDFQDNAGKTSIYNLQYMECNYIDQVFSIRGETDNDQGSIRNFAYANIDFINGYINTVTAHTHSFSDTVSISGTTGIGGTDPHNHGFSGSGAIGGTTGSTGTSESVPTNYGFSAANTLAQEVCNVEGTPLREGVDEPDDLPPVKETKTFGDFRFTQPMSTQLASAVMNTPFTGVPKVQTKSEEIILAALPSVEFATQGPKIVTDKTPKIPGTEGETIATGKDGPRRTSYASENYPVPGRISENIPKPVTTITGKGPKGSKVSLTDGGPWAYQVKQLMADSQTSSGLTLNVAKKMVEFINSASIIDDKYAIWAPIMITEGDQEIAYLISAEHIRLSDGTYWRATMDSAKDFAEKITATIPTLEQIELIKQEATSTGTIGYATDEYDLARYYGYLEDEGVKDPIVDRDELKDEHDRHPNVIGTGAGMKNVCDGILGSICRETDEDSALGIFGFIHKQSAENILSPWEEKDDSYWDWRVGCRLIKKFEDDSDQQGVLA